MFLRAFIVLEWLSVNPQGLTVGELQRRCKEYSKDQLRRTLTELLSERFVVADRQAGHGFGKVVYTLSKNVAHNCELIASNFLKHEAVK